MYRTLNAELSRKGIKKNDLAKVLNITPTTLSNKLNGKSIFTLDEALTIYEIVKVNFPLEELFEKAS